MGGRGNAGYSIHRAKASDSLPRAGGSIEVQKTRQMRTRDEEEDEKV